MINKQSTKRYPGPRAFQTDQRQVFYGRETDIRELYKTMRVHVLTVLHGKSGLGKTSLLQAGVMPLAQEQLQFLTHTLRFYAFDKQQHTNPEVQIFNQLSALTQGKKYFPDITAQVADPQLGLWGLVKSVQWANRDRKGLLLVFDQFEELFSYPVELVEAFARQFSELVNNRMPDAFQEKLFAAYTSDAQYGEKHQDEIAFIDHAPELHIILGIRSDRMAQLEKLSAWLPNILANRYELNPLSWPNAFEAIVQPAAQPGQFDSPPFKYSPEVLTAMENYLTSDRTKTVESTQLQVICQYLEAKVTQAGQVIGLAELGNIEDIYTNHYESIIGRLDKDEQEAARHLIEHELIYEKEERRLSLYEGQITSDLGMRSETLTKLVDSHLLRAEPHASGGYMYEISHDSLVGPILKVKRESDAIKEAQKLRAERDAAIQVERQRLADEQKERERNRMRLFLIVTSALTLVAGYGWWKAWKQQKDLKEAVEQLQLKNAENTELIAQVRMKSDSLGLANLTIIAQQYKEYVQKGSYLMEQGEYRQAIREFESAKSIDTPAKETAHLEELIQTSKNKAQVKERYEQIVKLAEAAKLKDDLVSAYAYYQQADRLDYDDAALEPQIDFLARSLKLQFYDLLRSADAYLYRGNSPEWACKLMKEEIEPIAKALKLHTDAKYAKMRASLDARQCK